MNLYLGMDSELLIVDPAHPAEAMAILHGTHITAIAVDTDDPDRIYCATSNNGLLRSVDAGNDWARIGEDVIASDHVLSVAVSPSEPGIIFAGTEPSALYRSDDGGDTWRELTSLQGIPSKPHWSFPPKPDTHHVRWIAPHPLDPNHLFVAIEAGALVQSLDGGETWQDRVSGGPIDSHTVHIHPALPDRLLSAAGDGFFQSDDRGRIWRKREEGLPWRYCYGLAIDHSHPDLVIMSVSPGAHRGHGRRNTAQATIVRKYGDAPWQEVSGGLPATEGTTLSILAADPEQTGVFYALNNTGLYRSDDRATSWHRLNASWKDSYLDHRPPALAVIPKPGT